jgi:spore coat protein A
MSTFNMPGSRLKSVFVLAALTGLGSASTHAAMQQPTLDPTTIPKYVIPLVIPPVMNNDGAANSYDIAVRQFKQQILPGGIWNTLNGRSDSFKPTLVWSYGPANDPLPASGVAPAANSQFNYPAYTLETTSDDAVDVRWINDLVDAKGNYLPHLLSIDQTVHWANPVQQCKMGPARTDCAGTDPMSYDGPVPIVTHVHGAHVAGHSDGYPEAWWLPAAKNIPRGYATSGTLFDDATGNNPGNLGYADFHYLNDQPATTLWYHDHSLGMTRNNVYAGPAGFWLVRGGVYDTVDDTSNSGSTTDGILPGPAPVAGQQVLDLNVPGNPVRKAIREIPIVIQDRSFDKNGQLFYPKSRAYFEGLTNKDMQIPFAPNSDVLPIWNPEAFFDVMVVNGVSWPELEVAPALYRFRLLNGCNSRFLWLKFGDPLDPDGNPLTADVPVYQIGAEQGFLPAPVNMNDLDLDESGDGNAQILMALAERADIIVDFRGLANGTEVYLTNLGPDEPFGGGIPGADFDPADPATTGKVMRFVVNTALNGASDTDPAGETPATDPLNLALNAEPASTAAIAATRQVSLNEAESHQVCVLADVNTEEFLLPVKAVDCLATVPPAGAVVVPFGPTEALLGTVADDGAGNLTGIPLKWTDTTGASTPVPVTMADGVTVKMINVTENPTVGDTEVWEIHNFTMDAHPIHLHLVRFEVVNREGAGGVRSPEPWESGYKDTVIAYPGEITRVKALFDMAGLYVWHCHIVEHEDNEMMRPYVVSAAD